MIIFKRIILLWIILYSSMSFAGVLLVGISGDMEEDTQKFALKEGDIIFQTLNSSQSWFISKATDSPATHIGILKKSQEHWVVVEAVGPVKETPLEDWLLQGENGFAFKRSLKKTLSDAQKDALFATLETYYGKPYDFLFMMDDEKIYCSELIYKAYKAMGIELGKVEKLKELNIQDADIQQVIRERAKNHPACKGKSFKKCEATILEQPMVTPASVYADDDLGEAVHIYITYIPDSDMLRTVRWTIDANLKQPLAVPRGEDF